MSDTGREVQEFLISEELWQRIEPLLPVRAKKAHPLGCHRQRVSDRAILNGIFFLLRTGGQWKSLNATGLCKSSTAHDRFLEWMDEGFFARLWEASLLEFDEMRGLDFEWMALDGALNKAPLGGGKKRPQPLRPRKKRHQEECADRRAGCSCGPGGGRSQPARHEVGA